MITKIGGCLLVWSRLCGSGARIKAGNPRDLGSNVLSRNSEHPHWIYTLLLWEYPTKVASKNIQLNIILTAKKRTAKMSRFRLWIHLWRTIPALHFSNRSHRLDGFAGFWNKVQKLFKWLSFHFSNSPGSLARWGNALVFLKEAGVARSKLARGSIEKVKSL